MGTLNTWPKELTARAHDCDASPYFEEKAELMEMYDEEDPPSSLMLGSPVYACSSATILIEMI